MARVCFRGERMPLGLWGQNWTRIDDVWNLGRTRLTSLVWKWCHQQVGWPVGEYLLPLEGWKRGLQQDVVLAWLVCPYAMFALFICLVWYVCACLCACVMCVFMCMCVCVCDVCVSESEDNSHEKVLSFHHVDYRDQTQILRLASKLLCLLHSRFWQIKMYLFLIFLCLVFPIYV